MSKKIVIITNNSCGLYKFRKELILELIKSGNKITALTPFDYNVEELKDLGIDIVKTPINRRGINPLEDFGLLKQYYSLIKKIKPELVILYTIKPNMYGGMVCRLLKIPYAVNITGLGTAFQNQGMLRKLVIAMYKVALKRAKVVFFENKENLQIFLDNEIIKENQCCLLNGAGVNTEYYLPAEYPQECNQTRFLFIGRVMKEKGIDELFYVMKRLSEEGFSCVLDVLGGYEEDYAEKIRAYEKEGWLNYYGFQSDVKPFIEKCHCFVLPSWHEGMANTNLECAAMGRPVITSNIHGCKEAVIENISGFLCEKKDVESLYRAMKEFIQLGFYARKEMGMAGRRHMEDVFDKRKVVFYTMSFL